MHNAGTSSKNIQGANTKKALRSANPALSRLKSVFKNHRRIVERVKKNPKQR
jgi:hypothetical protein